jgi:hypothetical protein
MVEGEALVTGFYVERGRGRCDSEGDGAEEELRDGKWKSVALDSTEMPSLIAPSSAFLQYSQGGLSAPSSHCELRSRENRSRRRKNYRISWSLLDLL